MKTRTQAQQDFNETGMNLSHINPATQAMFWVICDIIDEVRKEMGKKNQRQGEKISRLADSMHKHLTEGQSE